jgi:hypothetical protein
MEELIKEIQESIKTRKNGVVSQWWDYDVKGYVDKRHVPERGKGTIAYTVRRIQLLEDKLKELKRDLKSGKYDFRI